MTGQHRQASSEGNLTLTVSPSPRNLLLEPDRRCSNGDWLPPDTINCLRPSGQPVIPVIFEGAASMPLFGELQVWAQGQQRGALRVDVDPLTRQQVAIPVDVAGLAGNVRAEIRLVVEDGSAAPLQRAAIWLQVAPGE